MLKSALRGRVLLGVQGERMRKLSRAKDRDSDRRTKIAMAKRGKPQPVHVVEAMRAGNVGRVQDDEERQRRSATHKRKRTRPPKAGRKWTKVEDEMSRTLLAAELASRTGRTLPAVYDRRSELELPDSRQRLRV